MPSHPSPTLTHPPAQVRDMIEETCRMWLRDFNCDGLRFDSANDLPAELVQVRRGGMEGGRRGGGGEGESSSEGRRCIHTFTHGWNQVCGSARHHASRMWNGRRPNYSSHFPFHTPTRS